MSYFNDEKNKGFDFDFLFLMFVMLTIGVVFLREGLAKGVRTLRLNETSVARISIGVGRSTVLSFPTKPTKVILGNRGQFAIEYVERDLAISAISFKSHSNLFVYLEGRRFAFDLLATSGGADEIILVRDLLDSGVKVNFK